MAKKAVAKSRVAIDGLAVEVATYNLIAPDLKKFTAEYAEATDWSGIQDAASRNGISLPELNEAMREIRKETYKASLSVSNEDKLSEARKNMLAIGMDSSEVEALIEAQRAKMVNSLPTGLSPVYQTDAEGNQVLVDGKPVQAIAKRRGRQKAA